MKNNLLIILIVIIVLLGVGILAAVFYLPANTQHQAPQALKEGWTYQPSTLCKVDFPLPPRTADYMTDRGEYWRFQENVQNQGNPFFPNVAIAILQNPELGGSGYVAGSVVVSCKPNTENDTAQTLFQKYQAYFAAINQGVPAEAQITLTQSGTKTLWGREVAVVHFNGGMFNPEDEIYLFTTPSFSYAVAKPQHSTDPVVRQTTQEVLEKLQFVQ